MSFSIAHHQFYSICVSIIDPSFSCNCTNKEYHGKKSLLNGFAMPDMTFVNVEIVARYEY